MDRTTRQKFSKETEELNNAINQLDLTDIENIPSNRAEYTFFLTVHGTFSKIDHMLDHKIKF